MQFRNWRSGALILAAGLASLGARAADGDATLTGDWGGARADLEARGIAVDLGYRIDMLRVASGGQRRGGRPMSHFDAKAMLDLGQIAGWEGTRAYVNFIYDGGGKTNRDHLGSLLGTSNIEVPVSTPRFFHAWVEKAFDSQWAWLAGLYPIDSEFQVVESAALFVQPPYGAAPDLALTRGPSIFNNPAFGLRARWQSEDRRFYAIGAVLDGIPGDPDHPRGTRVKFAKGDGAMQIAELGYLPNASAEPADAEGTSAGAAKFALGYWRYTARADDLLDIDAAGDPARRRSFGWYALAEKTVWQWEGGDLAAFLRVGATDGNSTALERFYNAGIRVRGLVPGRDDDLFGIAHTRAATSAKYRASVPDTLGAEAATEITYRIPVGKWLAVQPVLQRFRNPGALGSVPSATVLGVRIDMAL